MLINQLIDPSSVSVKRSHQMYYQQQKSFKNVSFLVYKYIKKTSLYQHHDSKLHKVGTCRVFGLQFNLNFLFEEIQYLDVCLLLVLSSAKKKNIQKVPNVGRKKPKTLFKIRLLANLLEMLQFHKFYGYFENYEN